jgi:hypothetical protein
MIEGVYRKQYSYAFLRVAPWLLHPFARFGEGWELRRSEMQTPEDAGDTEDKQA